MAWKCNCSCDFRLLEKTRVESLVYALASVTLCTSVCMLFFLFSSRGVEDKTASLHGGTGPSCGPRVFDEPRMSSHTSIRLPLEKWHCKVHLRRQAGNDTLTVWLQWQRRLSLWFVFSTFPDRCLSSTSFDKEPTRLPFPKAISLKTLQITCRLICFRVKCQIQPYRFVWGGHHVLLKIWKQQYLIANYTSYFRGVRRHGTKLTTVLLTFCHCRNHSVVSSSTERERLDFNNPLIPIFRKQLHNYIKPTQITLFHNNK